MELLALSSNVTSLTALTTLDIRGCKNLNGKTLCQLQAFYSKAEITLKKMVAKRKSFDHFKERYQCGIESDLKHHKSCSEK